jgi:uncharacterized protein (UPF0332 family)
MNTPRDWIEEAMLRLEDVRSLLERKRPGRAVSTAYYAVHADGKGVLRAVDVEIETHNALYVQLSLHFVRKGALPNRTASLVQDLQQERLAVDYRLKCHGEADAVALVDDAQTLVDRIDALV